MRYRVIYFKILLVLYINTSAQEGFAFLKPQKNKVKVHFEFINNLIILPVKLNGVNLKFILDTGANEHLLFNDTDIKNLNLENLETVSLKGLGLLEPIEVITSTNNELTIGNVSDTNATFKIFQNTDINFSKRLGVMVHGIISSKLLFNYFTEINYEKQIINFYKKSKSKKKLRTYDVLDLEIYHKRFFVSPTVYLNYNYFPVKVLLDTGATDAIWLFENTHKHIKAPQLFIEDYLGSAIGGDIHGKVSRLPQLTLGSYTINNSLVSFPDNSAVKLIQGFNGRNGSLGAELLMRFNYFFDVNRKKLFFKKNKFFSNPIDYNMSGMEIAHGSSKIISEIDPKLQFEITDETKKTAVLSNLEKLHFYKFKLIPTYKIIQIRKPSPAFSSGLKEGDQILSVNGKKTKNYTLQEITHWFLEADDKFIEMLIKRDDEVLEISFKLKKVI